jgi:hypothetical protein
MTEKIKNIVESVIDGDIEIFKKNLIAVISEKIDEKLTEVSREISANILEQNPDQAKAAAELQKADAEKKALFVDPMMAKEFFLFDVDYKGYTITIKSLGTGINKPVIAYINDEQYEVFADKSVAKKESMQAIDKMIEKGITDLKYLRKSKEQIQQMKKAELEKQKEEEKLAKMEKESKK